MHGRDLAVLAVAYRCLPGVGSEGGQAWAWAAAAAQRHRVWLVTRADDADVVSRYLETTAEARVRASLVVVPVPEPRWAAALPDERWARLRYARWQLAVRETVRCLDRQVGPFDVAHHLTWACDWQPTLWPDGIPHVPLVWGPVGGGGGHAWRTASALGGRGVLEEWARQVLTAVGRVVFGRPVAAHAAVTVAANPYTARNFRRGGTRVVIEPGVALDPNEVRDTATVPLSAASAGSAPSQRVALYAGRLLRWKGVRFAIEGSPSRVPRAGGSTSTGRGTTSDTSAPWSTSSGWTDACGSWDDGRGPRCSARWATPMRSCSRACTTARAGRSPRRWRSGAR